MIFLLLSLMALWTAPLVHGMLTARSETRLLVNVVMPLGMCLLVALDVIPYAHAVLGPAALWLAAGGLVLPLLFERLGRGDAAERHRAFWGPVTLGLIGLAIHSVIDGAAFAGSGATGRLLLPVVVIMHRFVEGTFVWVTVKGQAGARAAAACLFLDSICTAAGYFGGRSLLSSISELDTAAAMQALVAGSLLHMVFHRHLPHEH